MIEKTTPKMPDKDDRPLRPEDHRRQPKKQRPYPLANYQFAEAVKVVAQENRIKVATLISSVTSQVALYPMEAIKTRMQAYVYPFRRFSVIFHISP
jgi:hypothetical protein